METQFITSKGDTFEVVTEWPSNYFVWPIGRHNFPFPSYLPLCKDGYNAESWQQNIDRQSLKAIKVQSEDIALKCLDAAIRGTATTREDYLKIING